METTERVPPWKPILIILALLLAVGVLVYPFMSWRVEQRELECGQTCSKKGFTGYYYTPPEGARFVRQDKCECVNLK